MSPKISLILNSYNPSHYLQRAIESVLQQTYRDFELLIWDDGSSDDSLDIARSMAAQDERVRVIAAPHQGRGKALKAAIAVTTGDYLGWIDRDDILLPNALEQTAAILDKHPQVGMVYSDYLDIDSQGTPLGLGYRCQIPYSRDRLLTDFITFHFRLMRREIYNQAGGIDPAFEYAEDYDLCLRISELTEIYHLPEPLYHYRHHRDNASRSQASLQQARSQCAINNALCRRGLQDTLQLQVQGGRFILKPRPTASRSRVAAVLASLSLPPNSPQRRRHPNPQRSGKSHHRNRQSRNFPNRTSQPNSRQLPIRHSATNHRTRLGDAETRQSPGSTNSGQRTNRRRLWLPTPSRRLWLPTKLYPSHTSPPLRWFIRPRSQDHRPQLSQDGNISFETRRDTL